MIFRYHIQESYNINSICLFSELLQFCSDYFFIFEPSSILKKVFCIHFSVSQKKYAKHFIVLIVLIKIGLYLLNGHISNITTSRRSCFRCNNGCILIGSCCKTDLITRCGSYNYGCIVHQLTYRS
ncbi:hypothetical protein SAMN05421542_2754 [Chryseobacterium jejuense]|uniref:Uncharacterized protein n=1 Tax=Chryseobacterium jejuense TaxID=445960 RepID=A0A2X2VHH2_CHRJE|nr:hypothetical protein SAMN05421542_2754 [Chryseobacterium jejuense]SQB27988.1 Uncharacterised protein [Chryseobacterium jejuense]